MFLRRGARRLCARCADRRTAASRRRRCCTASSGSAARWCRSWSTASTAERDDTTTGATGRFAILTPREIEIARLIGQGASNKRIARQLAITERTVKAHLTTIFRKTGVDDRVTLALLVSRAPLRCGAFTQLMPASRADS